VSEKVIGSEKGTPETPGTKKVPHLSDKESAYGSEWTVGPTHLKDLGEENLFNDGIHGSGTFLTRGTNQAYGINNARVISRRTD